MPDIKIREMKKGTIKTLDKAAVASERIKNVSANTKDMADDKGCKSEMIIVPMFSCHIVRHTFATRMIEAGVNVKVIQSGAYRC